MNTKEINIMPAKKKQSKTINKTSKKSTKVTKPTYYNKKF